MHTLQINVQAGQAAVGTDTPASWIRTGHVRGQVTGQCEDVGRPRQDSTKECAGSRSETTARYTRSPEPGSRALPT